MTSEIESIVRQMIKTSPPGNDGTIISDIKALLNNVDSNKLISNVLREHYTSEISEAKDKCGDVKLVKLSNGDLTIVSKYNLDGIKFFDTNKKITFDYDFINSNVIDIENTLPSNLNINSEILKLQNELNDYIVAHYNELSHGMIIPNSDDSLTIVIVGEKLNDANYYNGKWVGVYNWDSNISEVKCISKIRVHYYEDGNVVMNTVKEETISGINSNDKIIKSITEFEKKLELDTLKKINNLNEDKFKNLRRLMPISRSKIQWGRAIGNYKLGQDVVGGRH